MPENDEVANELGAVISFSEHVSNSFTFVNLLSYMYVEELVQVYLYGFRCHPKLISVLKIMKM